MCNQMGKGVGSFKNRLLDDKIRSLYITAERPVDAKGRKFAKTDSNRSLKGLVWDEMLN